MKAIVLVIVFKIAIAFHLKGDIDKSYVIKPLVINSIIENKIRELLENFRVTMLQGSKDVPILDPFFLDEHELDGTNIGLPKTKLFVENVNLEHMSTFVIHKLNAKLMSLLQRKYKIDFHIGIPLLYLDIENYILDALVEDVIIFGDGDAKFSAVNPELIGSIDLALKMDSDSGFYVDITGADIKLLLEGFKSNITGLLNDDELSELFNKLLETLIPDLIESYEKQISSYLNMKVPELLNKFMKSI